MVKIQLSDITFINKDKIKYLTGNKEEEIVFQECYDNYVKKNSNGVSKCVGVRDITANPPFIGLYSDPPLKILFESEEEFADFRNKIHNFDWLTLDLS
ncbi:hypothetical protein P5G65_04580 [Paenibacillus chondroitinus]|uniref:Uncharacterized protein n=1 Tax=Paenibacillus chondroitinus TaxID=59842 RepID=A0ABU6D8B2_9BACL|nr:MULTISPECIES: hypothetical protein [Paenibacillus]MCY9658175.1 hypothetical protein [Paenibacillus anseongense]MEB4793161.1 hypothetical protein [Paenibacillus chondroitinus]